MNTVITLVAIVFLGQAQPLKHYQGASGAYGQCKADAIVLRTTQHILPTEHRLIYRCNIKWVDKSKNG